MSPIVQSRRTLLALCLSGFPILAATAKPPPSETRPDLAGYKLILRDEFDGTSLDLSKWQVGTNPGGQQWGSDSYFVTSEPRDRALFRQVYIQRDGMLTMRANYWADFPDPTQSGRKWFSGMITTAFSDGRRPSAVFRRGYVEIRQKLPAGKGVWPANWACNLKSQQPGGDPLGTIELDGIEAYGVDMTILHTTIHNWNDKSYEIATASHLPDLSADFHTYGYLVGDTDVKTYLDGALVAQVPLFRADTVDKFYWMFNLAMGGGWPVDIPDSGHYDMLIDYIRIYSKDPDAVAISSE
jgi:beta-glucanase (GH16 family)